ncbi:MAG: SufS family cysteine desulfurase [Bdellovibrionales bacterium]|nr:SufS family cysteine desulfurase [Bdellovibrionales bacterium]
MTEARAHFPNLERKINGKPLVYFDSAATTLKPRSVIERIRNYYSNENANVHRGIHTLSNLGTQAFEAARENVRDFINASEVSEIVFTKGTTESINLLAQTMPGALLHAGDEILITAIEHHSNIVPWQMTAERHGMRVKAVFCDAQGNVTWPMIKAGITPRTKLIAFTAASNTLGTLLPVQEICTEAKKLGILTMVDAAQAVAHEPVDVKKWDCDFLAFSAHKIFGPTGFGVLYGKKALLEKLPPYQGGGAMIRKVTLEKTTYEDVPQRFEAGTPHIEGSIGLGEALNFVRQIGIQNIQTHETKLVKFALGELSRIPGLKWIGTPEKRGGILSFVIEGVHPHDIGTLLDQEGIAVRTGHHCTQPIMEFFKVSATVRISFSVYNTEEEITFLKTALEKAIRVLT